ncbi:MAG: hypothetical protein KBT04_07395 [Bacteroidales bacterium]|nr:hypothetical protein [Candidatus Colimorpha onthohippi]
MAVFPFVSCVKEQLDTPALYRPNSVSDTTATTYSIELIRVLSHEQLVKESSATVSGLVGEYASSLDPYQLEIDDLVYKLFNTRKYALCKDSVGADLHYKLYSIKYPGLTPDGRPTMLSGRVVVPYSKGRRPERIVLFNLPPFDVKISTPSQFTPPESILAADNAVCVLPDYYGFGATAGEPMPYIGNTYNAKCGVDMLLSAFDLLKDIGVELAPTYYTWMVGYSLSGAITLAEQRHIETQLTDAQQRMIRLKWSLCGAGPYNPELFLTHVLNADTLTDMSYVLLALQGFFNAHGHEMVPYTIADVLSPEAISNGYLDILSSTLVSNAQVQDMLQNNVGGNPRCIFSPQLYDTTSALSRRIRQLLALDCCNRNWQPKSKVALFHDVKDEVVPYCLTEETHRLFSESHNVSDIHHIKVIHNHLAGGFYFYLQSCLIPEPQLYKSYF